MFTKDVSEIFHIGWPDPNWVRGFSVAIRPLVDIDPSHLQDVMTSENIPGLDPFLARNNFDNTRVSQSRDGTGIVVVRDSLHCDMLGSKMHRTALESLNLRLDSLLRKT